MYPQISCAAWVMVILSRQGRKWFHCGYSRQSRTCLSTSITFAFLKPNPYLHRTIHIEWDNGKPIAAMNNQIYGSAAQEGPCCNLLVIHL